ncbi:hypothetical protein MRX96_053749, partial [Rhipicephalus microplus]
EQVHPLVFVEGALRDDFSTKALDGCSHHAALVEHASGQGESCRLQLHYPEQVAGFSTGACAVARKPPLQRREFPWR